MTNFGKAAGFLVFRRMKDEIQYLLLQTSYGHNHWTPPKGHLDGEESYLDAAFRETKEEAGLHKNELTVDEGFKRTLQYPVRGVQKTVVYWLAELAPSSSVKLSDEHRDYKWLNVNDIMAFIERYKDMQEIVRDAEIYLKSHTPTDDR